MHPFPEQVQTEVDNSNTLIGWVNDNQTCKEIDVLDNLEAPSEGII